MDDAGNGGPWQRRSASLMCPRSRATLAASLMQGPGIPIYRQSILGGPVVVVWGAFRSNHLIGTEVDNPLPPRAQGRYRQSIASDSLCSANPSVGHSRSSR